MTPYYSDLTVTLHHGDCLDILRELPDASVDSIVTDPPYGLEFMGKDWDSFGVGKRPQIGSADGSKFRQNMGTPSFTDSGNPTCRNCRGDKYRNGPRKCSCGQPDFGNPQAESMRGFQRWCEGWAAECLRVLKPGGHLLAFGGTRTWHRLTCAIEDAGFEVRDSIAWLYGSGFPKSLDVSKAIDKAAGRAATPPSPDVAACGVVATWLRAECSSRGITASHINQYFGAANIAMRWLMIEPTATKRPQVPTWSHWTRLREWLNLPDTMDAEVWRLNGNKGAPAPLAFAREEKRYEQSHGFARVGLAHGAQKSHTATTQVEIAGFATGPSDTPVTDDAHIWQGWGTALKPAHEPIVMARKPLMGTVAGNVLAHGTGALNIDGCRVEGAPELRGRDAIGTIPNGNDLTHGAMTRTPYAVPAGRWPANVVLDESQAEALDEQTGELTSGKMAAGTKPKGERTTYGQDAAAGYETVRDTPGDSGGASRFLYVAKADAGERVRVDGVAHPTVKPLSLMRWLVRLVTPVGGTVLEPFAGSGTTVEACILEGFKCVAIEREAEYLPLIQQRIHRRRDPVAAVRGAGEEGGLFDLLEGGVA